jgi:hypothetical protein
MEEGFGQSQDVIIGIGCPQRCAEKKTCDLKEVPMRTTIGKDAAWRLVFLSLTGR